MLKLVIDEQEYWDEGKEEFFTSGGFELELEHSLVSLSKWESRTKKPFLSKDSKSNEELYMYIEAMIISPIYPPNVVSKFTSEHLDAVKAYIESPESATTFGTLPEVKGRGETVTSELIYFWMVTFNVPMACEMWHLNRLFSLIRICNLKTQKPKKMSRGEVAARNRKLNAERRAKYNTRG